MNWQRFNPRNSFFGRIFFWFWLVTLSSIGTGVLVAYALAPAPEYSEPTQSQLSQLERAVERLERMRLTSRDQLVRRIRQFSQARNLDVFLIDKNSDDIIFGFPPPSRPAIRPYRDLINEPKPVVITRGSTRFIGPVAVTVNGNNYALFVGTTRFKPPSRGPLLLVVIGVALVVSGLLCYLLARSFAKPLNEIKQATDRLAVGDLTSRVTLTQRRHDEFAALSDATNHMATQLQRLFSEHQRFLADVSHELRSPLTRLQLAVGIAEQTFESQGPDNVDDSRVGAHIIARISKESELMEAMIQQLLWLSKLEVSADEHHPQSIRLDEFVGSAIKPLYKDLAFEAEQVNKQVSLDCANFSSQGSVQLYPELWNSALENVCRNAIKYANRNIVIKLSVTADTLCVVVEDDGDGVPEQELGMLFKPFYRTDKSRTRGTGGVGLGLSIAQRAIERHGGNISAKLNEQHGLAVRIEVPLNK
ncbi:ATP-binding protein [Alteromonas sp. ASW11-36]|uniref:histidine kinase n=1 Tax=Alteromonas arenosi TaxID=3055817 RepID=A0ABT7SZJ9_9ALTE|nr:ATP-binding protein [Alteromonas sp. ASW11-36]MDM7861605.1 ATP-binding protein [Alteromonas sp. ASW11-36]